ncbi:MAG: twin-arginine translocase subunit TatC [bacterium]
MNKSFLEHLEDLRWVLIKSVLALATTTILACYYAQKLAVFLRQPLEHALTARGMSAERFLITLDVTEPLMIMLEMGVFAGCVLACPFIFYFIAQFALPALPVSQRKMLLWVFVGGGLLFLLGAAFCYALVLPQAIAFFLDFSAWFGLRPVWTIRHYLDFVLQMIIAFGVSFELPLVILILARLGIVSAAWLRRYRRHAIVALVIFAACVTPTSDPYNLAVLFFPMYALYEISVLLAAWLGKKKGGE